MTTRRERREARGRRRRRADGTPRATRTWPRFSWMNFARRYVLALGLACIVIVGGLVGFRTSVNQKLSRIHTRHGLTLSHEPAANSGNFLVIGSDSRSFVENQTQAQAFGSAQQEGGQRSDTIMIAHVDPSQKRMLVVSLPRDTIVNVPGMGRTKINAAFNAGPQRLIDTIKQNFNVDIQHYVEVGFDSFSGIVDAIGHVPVQFPAPAYDPCTGLYVPTSGTAELNGQTALQYVRARHLLFYENGKWRDASPRADLDRIARQQGFIRQLATLAFKKAEKDVFAANDIADSVVSKLTADASLAHNHGELLALVRAFRDVNPADPTTFETVTLPVRSSGNGLALQQPDADELFQRLRTFGGPPPAPKNVAANQKKEVPSVVIKDGILNRSVIIPLSSPIPVPISSPMSAASQSFIPLVASCAVTMLLKIKLFPTERSYSPAIIKTPTPSAGIPTSMGIVYSAFWILAKLLKAKKSGLIKPKITLAI